MVLISVSRICFLKKMTESSSACPDELLQHLCQVDGLLCVLLNRKLLHKFIQMEDRPSLKIFDQRRKKVMNLLAAVL